MALQKMGSSVFHGGFSTFLAIFALTPAETYVFISFFRLWVGIIVFGMSNGFVLLPVLLSYVGPIQQIDDSSKSTSKVMSNEEIENQVVKGKS